MPDRVAPLAGFGLLPQPDGLRPPRLREGICQASDFVLSGFGSSHATFYLLHPLTHAARTWVEEHLPEVSSVGSAVIVTQNYVGPIVGDVINAGLRLLVH